MCQVLSLMAILPKRDSSSKTKIKATANICPLSICEKTVGLQGTSLGAWVLSQSVKCLLVQTWGSVLSPAPMSKAELRGNACNLSTREGRQVNSSALVASQLNLISKPQVLVGDPFSKPSWTAFEEQHLRLSSVHRRAHTYTHTHTFWNLLDH